VTLVAVHAGQDSAHVLFDQLVYNSVVTWIEDSPEPKAVELPGLDAATVFVGDFKLGRHWQDNAVTYAALCEDVDEFVHGFPDMFAKLCRGTVPELAVFVVGYSPARGRFVAYAAGRDDWFTFRDVSDVLTVFPSPPGYAPSEIEQRARAQIGKPPLPEGGEDYPPPQDDGQWVELAKLVHRGRAEPVWDQDLKVPMGGDVTLLTVTRGQVDQRVVHRFDDDDRERMLAGTVHPSQQMGLCMCGSGRRMLDCHLPKVFDVPCFCQSGLTFAECCKVSADVGRNDPCPCTSGRKFKKCCATLAAA